MRILDSNTLTTQINKFAETPLGLITNGSYYDKALLCPKPFQLFNTVGDSYDLSMNQRLLVQWATTSHAKTQGDTVVTDRYDSTICYIITSGARSNIPTMFKIRENNGTITIMNSVSYAGVPTSNPFCRCYLGQDSSFIYYIFDAATSFHSYFVKVDKSSLTMTVITDLSTYTWTNLIKETDNYIILGYKSGYGTNNIKRYNKTTAVTDSFTVSAKTGNAYFSSNYSNILSASDTNFYTYTVYYNTTTSKFAITRYTFDTTQTALASICVEADPTITWGTVTALPVFASNAYVHYESFITTINSKYYLNIAIWESNTSATSTNTSSYGIYTFLIDVTNNALTFKNFVQASTDYFRGFIGVKSNTFLVCAYPTACYFMNFDATNEKFVVTDSMANQPYHIGADLSDNIYIVDVLKNVEYLTPYIPTYVNIAWEKSSYDWKGTNISTYCTADTKNMSGTRVACNLTLTLKGSAVFTSNGSKTISITTSTTDVTQVPITINGNVTATISTQFTS